MRAKKQKSLTKIEDFVEVCYGTEIIGNTDGPSGVQGMFTFGGLTIAEDWVMVSRSSLEKLINEVKEQRQENRSDPIVKTITKKIYGGDS